MASPILVTGAIRSGTTWTGKMLLHSGETGYINEPFNVLQQPGWVSEPFPSQALYICSDNESAYARRVAGVMAMSYPIIQNIRSVRSLRGMARLLRDSERSVQYRLRRVRPLIKDPFALFSAEWLARRYDANVVIVIRHPAGFVSSLKRLNWGRDFAFLAGQDLLLRDYLGPFAHEICAYAEGGDEIDVIDRAILKWKCWYHVVRELEQRHPEWIFVKYEELAAEPVEGYKGLYERLTLRWDEKVAEKVSEFSSVLNPKEAPLWASPHTIRRDSLAATRTWRTRLSEGEIRRIRLGVGDVARHFYSEEDWR